jgi:PAS domain S-box-containing protein
MRGSVPAVDGADLIEAMIDAVVVIDLGGEVTLTNSAAVALSGYSRSELVALRVGQLFDDAVSGVRTRVREKIAAGEPLRREEAWLVTCSGTRIPVSIMASPILRDGTPVAIVLVARDARETRRLLVERDAEIARRREAETQLRHALTTIEAKVEDMRQQLLLSEQRATLGTLAGGVGHELRNIAQVQVDSIDALQDAISTGRDLAEPVRNILHDLERVSDHLVLHAKHLMQLAKPQREVLESLVADDIVRDVVKMLQRAGRLRRIQLELAASHPTLRVLVSRARIEQVLVNLILNSAESIKPPGTIWIRVAPRDQRVEIMVQDTGAGISPELADRIFEPYFTTKADQGTGLGLSIVRDIIEGYGGKVIVESVVGVGTTFRFDLPMADQTTVPS